MKFMTFWIREFQIKLEKKNVLNSVMKYILGFEL